MVKNQPFQEMYLLSKEKLGIFPSQSSSFSGKSVYFVSKRTEARFRCPNPNRAQWKPATKQGRDLYLSSTDSFYVVQGDLFHLLNYLKWPTRLVVFDEIRPCIHWFDRMKLSIKTAIVSRLTGELRKIPFYFSLYWLFNRDPYNGLL